MHSPSAPGHGVGAAVESALADMLGERLRYIGRATDLVWVGIGRDVDVPRRGGGTRTRGRLSGAPRTDSDVAIRG